MFPIGKSIVLRNLARNYRTIIANFLGMVIP